MREEYAVECKGLARVTPGDALGVPSGPGAGKGVEINYRIDEPWDRGDILSYDREHSEHKELWINADPLVLQGHGGAGNVGIGTAEPKCTVDCKGTIRAAGHGTLPQPPPQGSGEGVEILYSDAPGHHHRGWVQAYDRDSDQYRQLHINGRPLVLQYFDDPGNNVGIGTADPRAKLDVKGLARVIPPVGNPWPPQGSGVGIEIVYVDWEEPDRGQITTFDRDAAEYKPLLIDASTLALQSHGSAGNVGIGTTEPARKLHLQGRYGAAYVYNDPNDRPGLASVGGFPSVELFSVINNASLGPILRLGGYADDTETTQNHWVIGTPARNPSFLDFGFGPNANPHSGIRNYADGKTVMTLYNDDRGVWAEKRTGGGFDYAEYFESSDGNEISAGTAVVLEEDRIRPARKGEIPVGIISANPGIVGGCYIEWPKKYLRDEIGHQIMEEYKEEVMAPRTEKVTRERRRVEKKTVTEEVTRTEIVLEDGKWLQKEIAETVIQEVEEPVFDEFDLYDATGKTVIGKHRVPVMETYEEEVDVLDEHGQPVLVGTGKFVTKERPKLNPAYDESKEYVPRERRPEWNCVGLLGKLPLRKGQPVAESWIKMKDLPDEVELWLVK